MKILFFTDHFRPEPSAPAAHVYERAKLWAEWGHDVTVLTSAPNFPEGKVYPGYRNAWRFVETMDGIRVVRVKTFIAPNERFVKRTIDYISYAIAGNVIGFFEKKPDVVISTSPHLFVSLGAVVWSNLRGVPHVMEVRDLWPQSLLGATPLEPGLAYRLLERLELWLYRCSARIVSMTHAFQRDMTSRGVPAEKISVVINGANLGLFQPQPPDDAILDQYGLRGRVVIGYLGTLGLAQDLEKTVRAAALLRDTNITFFVVGVGAEKARLEQLVRELGLTNVVFAPRQLKEDMPRFWSVCDVSLIHLRDAPVFATVIPSKIFESMAVGLPILYAGPVGEGSALVDEHQAGVTVRAGDPEALADAARRLAADAGERKRLARNSLNAAPRFSRERQARDTLAAMMLAAGRAPTGATESIGTVAVGAGS